MTLLLCILLYIGAIVSPATYTTNEIGQIEQSNIQQIDQIKQDQNLLQSIESSFTNQANSVQIIDVGDK